MEICLGAILTQNTSWKNVEKALANLRSAGLMSVGALHAMPHAQLAEIIRPAGYYNVKAQRVSAAELGRCTLRYADIGTLRRMGALLEREGVARDFHGDEATLPDRSSIVSSISEERCELWCFGSRPRSRERPDDRRRQPAR